MNERIKALEQQCWSHRIDGTLVDGQLHFDTQKFAELIVRDVLDEVLQAMDDGMDVYDTVADKFGVKE
jgi:hypothetical protein